MIPENVSKWPARKKYFHFIWSQAYTISLWMISYDNSSFLVQETQSTWAHSTLYFSAQYNM